MSERYNPRCISGYCGAKFVTAGHMYEITENMMIQGRESIEGAEIELIAGLEEDCYLKVMEYLESRGDLAIEKLREFIFEKGNEPNKGLRLVILLSENGRKQSGKIGMITSPLQEIIAKEKT